MTEGKKFDWGEMLSITGQEKKKYKNADRMHEIVTELSNLDAWIIGATRKKGELEDTNTRLEAKKNELTQSVKDAKSVHTDIAAQSETLRSQIESLTEILASGGADKKRELDVELEDYKKVMNNIREKAGEDHASLMTVMSNELTSKQNKIDAANETLAELRSKL